jgi:hypothetical protein
MHLYLGRKDRLMFRYKEHGSFKQDSEVIRRKKHFWKYQDLPLMRGDLAREQHRRELLSCVLVSPCTCQQGLSC